MATHCSWTLRIGRSSNCPEKCANLTSLSRPGSSIITVRGDHEDVQLPRIQNDFCASTMMRACFVTRKHCSKDVDIRCLPPRLPARA